MLALIDADQFTYAIPFSCQTGKGEEVQLTEEANYLEHKLDKKINTVLVETGASDYKVFLQGEGNFRLKDPTYKANRKDFIKPLLYHKARQHLVEAHNAVLVEGKEADDEVIIEYNKCVALGIDAIMCHVDKDLDQAPGLHYKPAQGKSPSKIYTITQADGWFNLYKQALEGDRVDNITGVKGVGPVKAAKLLQGRDTSLQMYEKCCEVYKAEKKEETEEEAIARLDKNMVNLYLLRGEEDRWKRPT